MQSNNLLLKLLETPRRLIASFQELADRRHAEQLAFVAALEKQVEKHGIVAVTNAKNPLDLA